MTCSVHDSLSHSRQFTIFMMTDSATEHLLGHAAIALLKQAQAGGYVSPDFDRALSKIREDLVSSVRADDILGSVPS